MPPTPQHEALHRIFQIDKKLFARTISKILGADLTDPDKVTVLDSDLSEPRTHVRKADSVLLAELLVETAETRYIVVIESQTDEDEEKWFTWPYYISHLRDKHRCEVILIVVSSSAKTAQWARQPIICGLPGLTCMIVTPAGLGPDNVPLVTDLAEACADVGGAVFSSLTHKSSPEVGGILEVLSAALGTLDVETAKLLAELTEAGLAGSGGLLIWRNLMTTTAYPYVSQLRAQGQAEGREEGREEGRAQVIADVLDQRKISLTAQERQHILDCTDAAVLDLWVSRMLTVTTAAELFAE
jgi:hypothetical protein